jgi:hypothetical protein
VISPSQGRYLYTGQNKHRINAHTDIHALSGIRTQDPGVRASEDSSFFRPRGGRERLQTLYRRRRNTKNILCYDTTLFTQPALQELFSEGHRSDKAPRLRNSRRKCKHATSTTEISPQVAVQICLRKRVN